MQVLVDEGEEVLIPSPYWVSYPEMVKIAGGVEKIITTTQETSFKITKEILQNNITDKTKVLILNSPSNPTGMVYSREELLGLAEICVQKGVYIISDEIYDKLVYDNKEYVSLATLSKEIREKTIMVNGVSKAYAMTGWRIGYSVGSKEIMGYVKKLQDHSTSNPCSISQEAAIQALKEPEEVVEKMRDIFQERRNLVMSLMDEIPQIKYIKTEGSFYLFIDVSQLGESFDIAKKMLNDIYVAMIPGEGFGAPGYLRLSFSTSEERIREGLKRIKDWVNQQ